MPVLNVGVWYHDLRPVLGRYNDALVRLLGRQPVHDDDAGADFLKQDLEVRVSTQPLGEVGCCLVGLL